MVKKKQEPADPERDDTGDILDLGALTKPPRLVAIDGVQYEMLNTANLGVGPRLRLSNVYERIDKLEKKGKTNGGLTAKEEAEYDGRLLEMAKMLLPSAPVEVVNQMPIEMRQTLVLDFLFVKASESPRQQTLAKVVGSIGSKPSPHSNGSTAAEPGKTGSNGRRPK